MGRALKAEPSRPPRTCCNQGFIQGADHVISSRTVCPSFLPREEIMLGTCAHLWDPPSPSPKKHQGQLVPGSRGGRFQTEGLCLVGTCETLSLISCPATDFLDALGLPGFLISTQMEQGLTILLGAVPDGCSSVGC